MLLKVICDQGLFHLKNVSSLAALMPCGATAIAQMPADASAFALIAPSEGTKSSSHRMRSGAAFFAFC